MIQKVKSYIQSCQLLQPAEPVIVAVSGGADSVALWHVLDTLGYNCIIAHCNFHLRGEESDRDERFVRQLATDHDVPFFKTDFNTTAYAEQHGISIEMAARDLRYDWFEQLRQDLHAQAIAVAHHADDNIETLLMNLLRGTGLRGMTGIPKRNGWVVRPLLACSRQEIEHYIAEQHLHFVTDSTNKSTDYKRNKIRNVLLPLLEDINPATRQTLYATVERMNDAYELYGQAIDLIKAETVRTTGHSTNIDIEKLLHHNAYRSVLFEVLQPFGFSPACIQQVAESLQGESGKRFYSDTHLLLKDRQYLVIQKRNDLRNLSAKPYLIDADCELLQQPFRLHMKRIGRDEQFRVSKTRDKIHVDFDKLTFPLTLRKWQEGDVFQPFGMKGKKKVSDFFIDCKLNVIEKEECWLLLSGNEIVWIVGLRTDDRFKITKDTRQILELKVDLAALPK